MAMLSSKAPLENLVSHFAKSEFYQKKRNRLLLHLDLGMVYHRYGKYRASALELSKAKELGRDLYTQSISKKAQALILNDNYDIYYGEKYEHSLIRFYLSLSHFMSYQLGEYQSYPYWDLGGVNGKVVSAKGRRLSESEKRRELMAARAELLDWDVYLQGLKYHYKGDAFKSDMLAKTYGARVHEALNTRAERRIALQLYKDGKKLLGKNYSAYGAFKKKVISGQLKSHLEEKIARLRRGKADKENVTIIWHPKFIPPKVGERHYYSLESVFVDNKSSSAAVSATRFGIDVLSLFAIKELGLIPPPATYTPGKAHLGISAAHITLHGAAVSFELPKIKYSGDYKKIDLEVKDPKGKKVFSGPMVMVAPMGDIANLAVVEGAAARYKRLGVRLGLKYLSAIVVAYTIFQNSDNPVSRSAALLAFTTFSRSMALVERADTRYWSTLPSEVRMAGLSLSKGQYKVRIHHKSSTLYEGDLAVSGSKPAQLHNIW